MYDHELFTTCKTVVESTHGIAEAHKVLPSGAAFSVIIGGNIPAKLVISSEGAQLLAEKCENPDWEITVMPEAIRRLEESKPSSLLNLISELSEMLVAGHLKVKLQIEPTQLFAKGYVRALKGWGPELQKELITAGFGALGQAQEAIDKLKKALNL
jgi:hypothetical protein